MAQEKETNVLLARIATALEKLVPEEKFANDLAAADAFVWQAENTWLEPVADVNRIEISLLKGIDRQIDTLVENTKRFADGLPANNAVNRDIKQKDARVALVEIHREDIPSLPQLLSVLRNSERPCLVFCDDLSFDGQDASYKSLKALLEGGIEGRPKNVLFYATSNRRHLLPRDMMENERSTAINPSEAVEEKVSLSDRFGLWLGFHNCDQDTYFAIIGAYIAHYGLEIPEDQWKAEAKEWTVTRGSRSGRVASQYIQDIAGRLGKKLD